MSDKSVIQGTLLSVLREGDGTWTAALRVGDGVVEIAVDDDNLARRLRREQAGTGIPGAFTVSRGPDGISYVDSVKSASALAEFRRRRTPEGGSPALVLAVTRDVCEIVFQTLAKQAALGVSAVPAHDRAALVESIAQFRTARRAGIHAHDENLRMALEAVRKLAGDTARILSRYDAIKAADVRRARTGATLCLDALRAARLKADSGEAVVETCRPLRDLLDDHPQARLQAAARIALSAHGSLRDHGTGRQDRQARGILAALTRAGEGVIARGETAVALRLAWTGLAEAFADHRASRPLGRIGSEGRKLAAAARNVAFALSLIAEPKPELPFVRARRSPGPESALAALLELQQVRGLKVVGIGRDASGRVVTSFDNGDRIVVSGATCSLVDAADRPLALAAEDGSVEHRSPADDPNEFDAEDALRARPH